MSTSARTSPIEPDLTTVRIDAAVVDGDQRRRRGDRRLRVRGRRRAPARWPMPPASAPRCTDRSAPSSSIASASSPSTSAATVGQHVPSGDDDFGWDRMAEDVLAVVERLDPPIAGFGHSMGGAALLLAEERRPGTFRSLFLFEPIVLPDDFAPVGSNYMAELARGRRSTFPSRDEAFARYASRPPLNTMRADVLQGVRRRRLRRSPRRIGPPGVSPRRRGQDVRVGDQAARLDVSRTSRSPVTVVVGHDEEGPNPARLGPGLVAALPTAELIRATRARPPRTVPGSGVRRRRRRAPIWGRFVAGADTNLPHKPT